MRVVIEVCNLTKRYGPVTVLDDVSFTAAAGKVTGFLGPNGAGKTTTMRCALDLIVPTAGQVLIGGRRYRDSTSPMRVVGAVLDAQACHRSRSGIDHLRALAASNALPRGRAAELLQFVGLAKAATAPVGAYSLGMRQRLGIAQALLGDPGVLIFDEPLNGLDVVGVRWMRSLLSALAADGRAVLYSSHLMSEVEHTADQVVMITAGRVVYDGAMSTLLDEGGARVHVQTADPPALAALIAQAGGHTTAGEAVDTLLVTGLDAPKVSDLAYAARIQVSELRTIRASLEERYVQMIAAGEVAS